MSIDIISARRIYNEEFIQSLRLQRAKNPTGIKENWPMDNSTAVGHSRLFGALISGTKVPPSRKGQRNVVEVARFLLERTSDDFQWLKRAVHEKREQNGSFRVLDLMSYGGLIRDLDVEGCSIALSDARTPQQRTSDNAHNRRLITGNLLDSSVWKQASTYLAESGEANEKFDLVVCKPGAALDNIPAGEATYTYLFNKIYPLLSDNDGMLFTVFHPKMIRYVHQVSRNLRRISGLYAKYDPGGGLIYDPVFYMVKGKEAPVKP